ncbi:MAG: hypothetical protein IAF02_24210 [Anaerolineae bacterium]|nr:hypothetical protein [Anaerolineae bacterium]
MKKSLLHLLMLLILAACASPAPGTAVPTVSPSAEPTIPSTAEPAPTAETNDVLPVAMEYNLGETTIVQSRFPEDSRFHNMPVRLNGVIAAPTGGDGPYPVVLIIHGTHHGCPEEEGGVDRWPCDPEVEQPNYQGFAYLVEALAAEGYVAIAPNFNAENTFGFGEGTPGERLSQLLALHMGALAEAAAGGPNDFGVELDGRADMSRLAFFGHSRGGEAASWLTNSQGLAAPDAAETFGYGPVSGLLLLAPAPIFTLPAGSRVPQVVILPACDGDVMDQEGQLFYEGARLDPSQEQWALSVWLEQANHNAFNEILGPDMVGFSDRPDCAPLLDPSDQRQFLTDIGLTFLTTIFSDDPQAVAEAKARLGIDSTALTQDSLFGQPARVMTLAEAAKRQPLLVPASADELTTNLVGGAVEADGLTTLFCQEGYYTPSMKPGSEPCKRVNLVIPGNPAMMVVSWEESGAALRLTLPEGAGDLSDFTTISLRTAVDPTSSLNSPDTYQAFTVQLTDKSGTTATVQTRSDEPALLYPLGDIEEDSFFEGGFFTGRVPMTTVRLLVSDFAGVDLTQISEVALVFDQTPSGSLFMGDMEFVKP